MTPVTRPPPFLPFSPPPTAYELRQPKTWESKGLRGVDLKAGFPNWCFSRHISCGGWGQRSEGDPTLFGSLPFQALPPPFAAPEGEAEPFGGHPQETVEALGGPPSPQETPSLGCGAPLVGEELWVADKGDSAHRPTLQRALGNGCFRKGETSPPPPSLLGSLPTQRWLGTARPSVPQDLVKRWQGGVWEVCDASPPPSPGWPTLLTSSLFGPMSQRVWITVQSYAVALTLCR